MNCPEDSEKHQKFERAYHLKLLHLRKKYDNKMQLVQAKKMYLRHCRPHYSMKIFGPSERCEKAQENFLEAIAKYEYNEEILKMEKTLEY